MLELGRGVILLFSDRVGTCLVAILASLVRAAHAGIIWLLKGTDGPNLDLNPTHLQTFISKKVTPNCQNLRAVTTQYDDDIMQDSAVMGVRVVTHQPTGHDLTRLHVRDVEKEVLELRRRGRGHQNDAARR